MKRGDLRCFVGVPIFGAVARRLERENGFLQLAGAKCGWTATRNFHFTLNFLGTVTPEEVIPVGEIIEEVTEEIPSVRLSISKLMTLPLGSERPRIVAAGIEGEVEPLQDLYQRLKRGFGKLGFKPDKRPLELHVTLARIKADKNVDKLLERVESAKNQDFGVIQCSEVHLMMSDLTEEGPIYTTLNSYELLG